MNHLRCSWRVFLGASLHGGAILGLSFAFAGHAQSLPAGPGSATVQRVCSKCHNITVVTARRLSEAGWENVVENMISRGAAASPDEQEEVVSYLAANFGPNAPAPQNTASGKASVPVQAPPPPPALDSSQVARAKELIESNGCLSCHQMNGQGSFAGPYLGDAGASLSVEQISAALVSPSKELSPRNRTVSLVTRDGKKVDGKLLNQDGFSVQLIDASGQLLTFERANLRNFTIVTENPMPSYANRMAPQDISLLVKYLETLTGRSQQE